MHRDYRLYLDDILEAVSKIRDYTAGINRSPNTTNGDGEG